MAEDLYAVAQEARGGGLRVQGYEGDKYFSVWHPAHPMLRVFSPDKAAAIYAAGRYWGEDPRKAEFHQGCRVI